MIYHMPFLVNRSCNTEKIQFCSGVHTERGVLTLSRDRPINCMRRHGMRHLPTLICLFRSRWPVCVGHHFLCYFHISLILNYWWFLILIYLSALYQYLLSQSLSLFCTFISSVQYICHGTSHIVINQLAITEQNNNALRNVPEVGFFYYAEKNIVCFLWYMKFIIISI